MTTILWMRLERCSEKRGKSSGLIKSGGLKFFCACCFCRPSPPEGGDTLGGTIYKKGGSIPTGIAPPRSGRSNPARASRSSKPNRWGASIYLYPPARADNPRQQVAGWAFGMAFASACKYRAKAAAPPLQIPKPLQSSTQTLENALYIGICSTSTYGGHSSKTGGQAMFGKAN